MKKSKVLLFAALFFIGLQGLSDATLFDRGSGLIFDSSLNITWLQNSNLAASEDFDVTGIDTDGGMTWSTANDWIAAMNIENYLGYSNWRLPKLDVNGDGDIQAYWLGSVDELTSRDNEPGYMYRYNLGGTLHVDDFRGDQLVGGVALFNIQKEYWTSTAGSSGGMRYFDFSDGSQPQGGTGNTFSVWAVRDGDVAPVPEPTTMLLLGSGFIGLLGFRRKIKKKRYLLYI